MDDNLDSPESTMRPVVAQIESAGLPVITQTTVPAVETIRHWHGFSLIVLDWDMSTPGVDDLPAGVTVGSQLDEQVRQSVIALIRAVLDELFAPIFVISNSPSESIRSTLALSLGLDESELDKRILFMGKLEAGSSLLEKLAAWVEAHPSFHVLKMWDNGYATAKKQAFSDFHGSSSDWPKVLWSAASGDDVEPSFELAQVISLNVLHRLEPINFDESRFAFAAGEAGSVDHIRRFVQRRAVVDGASLHESVLMPGDMYSVPASTAGDPPRQFRICVTPACDLVRRTGQDVSQVQANFVLAELIDDKDLITKGQRKLLEHDEESVNSMVFHVLHPSARPYLIRFKAWERLPFGELGLPRSGRLMEPYVSLLLQRFASYIVRNGLPKVPDSYAYSPPSNPVQAEPKK